MSREVMQQALDALEQQECFVDGYYMPIPAVTDAMNALRSALAQPQAQPALAPAGWVMVPRHLSVDQLERFVGHGLCCGFDPITEAVIDAGHKWARLLDRISAAPAAPAVQPLTDEQIEQLRLDICDLHILGHMAAYKLARAAIAKFCEVNGIAAPGEKP